VPEMEAIYGWFESGFGLPPRAQPAHVQGFDAKRLKGFEPSTFCMAIGPAVKALRRKSGLSAAPS
jgi:hypothetical protein